MKSIENHKNILISKGTIRKQKSLEIKTNETPYNLPDKWQWIRLSEIAYPQAGFAFSSKNFNEAKLGLPLIRIRDVGQKFSGTFFSGDFREEFLVKKGDYLISMDGNFRIAPWENSEALLNQRVSRLIFFGEDVSPKYLQFHFRLSYQSFKAQNHIQP